MTSSWAGRRVLVTGAGGFIGSHLVEALVTDGATVTALVHYNSRGDTGNLQRVDSHLIADVEVVAGDVRDGALVGKTVRGKDVVFHLAALIGIPYSYDAPDSYLETNAIGTLHVLRACLGEEVGRVIHTSTSEVYGTAQYVPMDEHHPLQAQSPYSATKIAADKLAESFYLSFGLPVATVRPFNTYGPRQSARAVIPTILTQLAAGVQKLRLGSLDPIRDFTYVNDTVRGFLAIAVAEATVGQVTNLGTGTGVTVAELLDACCAVAGRRIELAVDEQRVRPSKSEVLRLVCANDKALELAGWKPSYTLRDGLADTYAYIREHIGSYRPDHYAL